MAKEIGILCTEICACEELNATNATNVIQLFPAGRFRSIDGRPKKPEEGWYMDEMVAQSVIASMLTSKNDVVIDYNHATLVDGHEAPAAGWIKRSNFFWKNGFFAVPDWTEKARTQILTREQRYISPVFSFDTKTGHILDVHSVAVTNTPALDAMQELAITKKILLMNNNNDENPQQQVATIDLRRVVYSSSEILDILQLRADASTEEVIEAITLLFRQKQVAEEAIQAVKATLGIAANEDAIVALKSKLASVAPSISLLEGKNKKIQELTEEIEGLKAQNTQQQKESLIYFAQIEGKLPLGLENEDNEELQYVKQLPLELLKDYLNRLPSVPLTNQTRNFSPLVNVFNEDKTLLRNFPEDQIVSQDSLRRLRNAKGL